MTSYDPDDLRRTRLPEQKAQNPPRSLSGENGSADSWGKLEKKLAKYRLVKSTGRPGYPLLVMLRIHCMQLFYNLSDPAMEYALYEIESMRRFAGLTLSDALPDESTILHFRHFLEQHKLSSLILDTINQHLASQGMMLRDVTIADATIIRALLSTQKQPESAISK